MAKLLDGNGNDIIQQNHKALCDEGMNESQAMHLALKYAKKGKTADRVAKGVVRKMRSQGKVEVK